ncbi:LOW QUALITY PROTEIN: hypothetical protein HZS_6417, partial [Henneguya salminicola]
WKSIKHARVSLQLLASRKILRAIFGSEELAIVYLVQKEIVKISTVAPFCLGTVNQCATKSCRKRNAFCGRTFFSKIKLLTVGFLGSKIGRSKQL